MKYLYRCVFVLSIVEISELSGRDVDPKNEIEEQILQLFRKWRSGDVFSLPFALPALDVIKTPPLDGHYSGNGVKVTYSSSEMTIIGLSNFSVVDLNVSESNLEASGVIRIPMTSISADNYNLNGRMYYVYSLTGSGRMEIVVGKTEISFKLHLTYNGTGTCVDELGLDFNIDSIKVYFENSSWPLNAILSSQGVTIIKGYHDDIITCTRENILCIFNEYLATRTPQQLLNTIRMEDCNCLEC